MPVIPALRRLRQEDLKFEAGVGYTARPCHKKEEKRGGEGREGEGGEREREKEKGRKEERTEGRKEGKKERKVCKKLGEKQETFLLTSPRTIKISRGEDLKILNKPCCK
jgi:hypothetical protein